VIVKFKSDGPLMRESALAARTGELPRVQHASRLSQRHGVAMRDGYPVAPRTQVVFAQGLSSAELVAKLQADPDVEYAEVDVRVKRAAAPNDPLYGPQSGNVTPAVGQWYLRNPAVNGQVSSINAEQAWDLTVGSPAIVVAVLDTGVRGDHPDLVGKLLRGYDFVSEDAPNSFATANDGDGRDADPSDPGDWVTSEEVPNLVGCQQDDVGPSSWHGTQTTSLVAAATNETPPVGMAGTGRNVRVLPVRVLGKCGGFTSDVIAGMYWAAGLQIPPVSNNVSLGSAPTNTTPAKVLNLSLGGSATSCSQLYQDAINAVIGAGASVVVSAGNGGGTSVGQPANCSNVIAVGGLRHAGTKSGFSDMGPQVSISAPAGNCPLPDGPGGECRFAILAAANNGATVPAANSYSDGLNNVSIGTSFSSPMAAGVAALMLSKNPTLSPASVRSIMLGAARTFPTTGGTSGAPVCPAMNSSGECYCTNATCGTGMLDAAAALAATTLPAQPRALIFTTPAMPLPNSTISVDGSTSVGGNGTSISNYVWSLPSQTGGAVASFVGPSSGPAVSTATISIVGEGTFTVRLIVTDALNGQNTQDFIVSAVTSVQQSGNPSTGSSGGGGALSWPWLLALLVAVAALRPRRAL
jgi:serine protease